MAMDKRFVNATLKEAWCHECGYVEDVDAVETRDTCWWWCPLCGREYDDFPGELETCEQCGSYAITYTYGIPASDGTESGHVSTCQDCGLVTT